MSKEPERVGWPTPVCWLTWLTYLVTWSVALLTTQPAHIAVAVLPPPARFPVAKLLHVAAYLVLTVLTGWLHAPGRWRWLLLLFLTAHACGTEFFQQFVPERTGSLRDVAIDHAGIGLGLLWSWKWWRAGSTI